MSTRKFSRLNVAVVVVGALSLWWFFPREDKNTWRFAPDVSLPGGNSRARSVTFSPDGHTLAVSTLVFPATYPRTAHASGSRQRRCEVQLWDVSSRQRKTTLVISEKDVPRAASEPEMAFSRDGRQLRFWGIGTTTWDVTTATRLSYQSWGQPSPIQDDFGVPEAPWVSDRELSDSARGTAMSGDGLWYAGQFLVPSKAFAGEFVKLWRRSAPGKPWRSAGMIPASVVNREIIYDLDLSPDGKLLAVAVHDGSLQLFATSPLRRLRSLPSSNWIIEVAFSPDGRYLIGGGGTNGVGFSRRGGVLDFWNVATGNLDYTVNSPKVLHNPVFSSDGGWIGANEGEETVFVCRSPLIQRLTP